MYPSADNAAKAKAISEWIDPQERVTVDFLDEKGLNVEVTRCTPETIDLTLETAAPHFKQHVTIPLGKVEIGEDRARYTRDPDRPLRYGRLRLTIDEKRPPVI